MAKEKVVTPKGEVVMVLTGKDAFDAMLRMMVECAEGGNKTTTGYPNMKNGFEIKSGGRWLIEGKWYLATAYVVSGGGFSANLIDPHFKHCTTQRAG